MFGFRSLAESFLRSLGGYRISSAWRFVADSEAADGRRDNCFLARNDGAMLTFVCSSIPVGVGGMILTTSPWLTGGMDGIIPPPSLVQDVSAEFTELMLKSEGARECAADETEVVEALLSLAILEAGSPSSVKWKSASRL